MKAIIIPGRERADINTQVEKVLRGLGNPEPPLQLDDVRELLRLDRQYYSVTDDGALREFISKVKIGAQQLFLRPALIFDVFKKAGLSALYIPDRKRVVIDRDLPPLKHRWAEIHEVAHSIIEWHHLYLFGDTQKELNPACHEQLEAEANYGAGQLLFLRERFCNDARDLAMNVANIRALAKRFGNTITSTLWRYIEELGMELPMAALVTPHPSRLPGDHDPANPCKHFIPSPAFRQRFAPVTEIEMFSVLSGYCSNARGGPLGTDEVCLSDCNGDSHIFLFESFFNQHEVLTLAYLVRRHNLVISVPRTASLQPADSNPREMSIIGSLSSPSLPKKIDPGAF